MNCDEFTSETPPPDANPAPPGPAGSGRGGSGGAAFEGEEGGGVQWGLGSKKSDGYDHRPFLTSVRAIQHFMKLDFLTSLPDDVEERVEKAKATELWPED